MPTIEIKLFDKPTDGWDGFDASTAHPANTSFFSRVHADSVTKPLFLEVHRDGRKIAQWLVFKKRGRIRFWNSILFSFCGPQIVAECGELADEIFTECFAFLRDNFKPAEIQALNYTLTRGIRESALRNCGFTQIDRFVYYLNDLSLSEDEQLAGFHASHRNDTRKAIREGYQYVPEIAVPDYFRLSEETYARSGSKGPSLGYLHRLKEMMAANSTALISGVLVNGKLNCGSVILYHGTNAYYMHGASITEKVRGATTFIQYENMKWLKGAGVKRYDLGGAQLSRADEKSLPIAAFKEKFGGQRMEGFGGIWNRRKSAQ